MGEWNNLFTVKHPVPFGICIGFGVGAAIGAIAGHQLIGVGLGMVAGAFYGLSLKKQQEKKPGPEA